MTTIDAALFANYVAAADDALPDYLSPILSTGLVGVFLILLATETIFITKKSFDRAIADKNKEIDALREDNEELKAIVKENMESYNKDVVPALTRAIDQNRQSIEIQKEYVNVLIDHPDIRPRRRPPIGLE